MRTDLDNLSRNDQKALHALQLEVDTELFNRQRTRRNGFIENNGKITGLHLQDLQLEKIPSAISKFEHLRELHLDRNQISNITSINNLTFLRILDVSDNQVEDISFVKELSFLQVLKISKNGIRNIDPVEHQDKLVQLDLSNNELDNLSPLTKLTKLNTLNLSSTKINRINGIETCVYLKNLDLSFNDLEDISLLSKLVKLERLQLLFNRVADATPLLLLSELRELDLTYCYLENIDWIVQLNKLVDLNISYNKIQDISPLSSLNLLEKLSIRYNSVLEDLSILGELTSLKSLDCSNSESINVSHISRCANLESLSIKNIELKNIDFLENLTRLQHLDLQGNKLTNIDVLAGHKALSDLNIEANYIKIFPEWILRSGMENRQASIYGSGYSFDKNLIENVPQEFLKMDNSSIADYLKSLEDGANAINEIKVILLGEGAAGKTSLVNLLQGKPFDQNQSQTHGINIAEYAKELGVTMKIWDFGGQDIMHHTHQLFLTKNSVYVIVLNARENNDTEKWLKLVKVFGGDSPVILVTNKIDENPSSHENIRFLNEKYSNLDGRYARISCSTGQGLAEFDVILQDTIASLLHVRTMWGISWLGVKVELEKMRSGNQLTDYINYGKYEELCELHQVLPQHRETLINWLHQLGVITYFPEANLNETNVINPSWLTVAFYTIINARIVADNFGRFTLQNLQSILPAHKYPKQKFGFLLGLMTKFELCYQIDSDTYLIPDLLRKEEPELSIPSSGLLRFKFQYSALLPKSMLAKFIVRRHSEICENLQWRTGVVIEDRSFNSRAIIKIDEDEKEISIYVTGDEQRGYLSSVLSTFRSINKLYEGLEFEELVPCTCKSCKGTEKPHYFKYSLLFKMKQSNRGQIMCEKSLIDVPVNDLLGTLIKPAEVESLLRELVGTGSFVIKQSLEGVDLTRFIEAITSLFSSVSYLLFEKSEKSYHFPLFLILRQVFGNSAKADEVQSTGRADIILNLNAHIFIFEIKLDGSAKQALQQIYDKNYYAPYWLENKPIFLVGLNFSSITRNISEFVFEELDRNSRSPITF